MSAGGGCESAVSAKARCGWLSLGSAVSCCMAGDFLLSLKGLFISYVRPAILYGSEAWCLKESEMGILLRTERSMV